MKKACKINTHILLNLNKSSHVNGLNVVILACCWVLFHQRKGRHRVKLENHLRHLLDRRCELIRHVIGFVTDF